jgi:hypothetical protein
VLELPAEGEALVEQDWVFVVELDANAVDHALDAVLQLNLELISDCVIPE